MKCFQWVCCLFLVQATAWAGFSDYFSGPKKVAIVFLGKTGAGKSTQIVGMHNLIKGKKYSDKKEIIIPIRDNQGNRVPCDTGSCTHSESDEDGTVSQTQDCHHYHVSNTEYDVLLIDTPGIGDTRGVQYDQKNIDLIVNEIGKHKINVIAFVLPSSDTRASSYLGYYVTELKKMLVKSSKNNFVIIQSHSGKVNGSSLESIRKHGVPIEANNANVFAFDLAGLFSSDDLVDEAKWNQSLITVKKLLDYASKLSAVDVDTIVDLQKNRKNLKSKMDDQIHHIKKILDEEKLWAQYQADIDEAQKKIDLNQDFVIRKPVPKEERIALPAGQKDTVCLTCGNSCHHDCQLPGIHQERGHPDLANCHAMNRQGICKYCGHPLGVHIHQTYRIRKWNDIEEEIYSPKKVAKEEAENIRKNLEAKKNESRDRVKQIREQDLPKANKEIANLNRLIKEQALSPANEYYLEHLKEQALSVQEDSKLSSRDRNRLLDDIIKAREQYELAKRAVEEAERAEEGQDL